MYILTNEHSVIPDDIPNNCIAVEPEVLNPAPNTKELGMRITIRRGETMTMVLPLSECRQLAYALLRLDKPPVLSHETATRLFGVPPLVSS